MHMVRKHVDTTRCIMNSVCCFECCAINLCFFDCMRCCFIFKHRFLICVCSVSRLICMCTHILRYAKWFSNSKHINTTFLVCIYTWVVRTASSIFIYTYLNTWVHSIYMQMCFFNDIHVITSTHTCIHKVARKTIHAYANMHVHTPSMTFTSTHTSTQNIYIYINASHTHAHTTSHICTTICRNKTEIMHMDKTMV